MKVLALCVLFVTIAAVIGKQCHHDDLSQCTDMTCAGTDVIMCEHDVCTCSAPVVVVGASCMDGTECKTVHCHHGENPHCVDTICKCIRDH